MQLSKSWFFWVDCSKKRISIEELQGSLFKRRISHCTCRVGYDFLPFGIYISSFRNNEQSNCNFITARRPPEPDDILWENLGQSLFGTSCRRILTTIIVIVFLIVSTAVIVFAKAQETKSVLDYPSCPNSNYETFYYDYTTPATWNPGGGGTTLSSYDVAIDYKFQFYNNSEGNTGLLGCMCEAIRKNEGYRLSLKYRFPVAPGGTSADDRKWCSSYYEGVIRVYSYRSFAVAAVIVVNLLLEFVADWSSNFERHTSLSTKEAKKTLKLFLSTFLNTAILLLIINGNLSYFGYSALKLWNNDAVRFFDGPFGDLTEDWYRIVGFTITTTLLTNSIAGPLSNVTPYLKALVLRYIDRGFRCHAKVTKQT